MGAAARADVLARAIGDVQARGPSVTKNFENAAQQAERAAAAADALAENTARAAKTAADFAPPCS